MFDFGLIQQGLRSIDSDATLATTLKELVQLAVSAAKADAGSLYLVDQKRQVLTPLIVVGLPEDYVKGCGEVPVGEQCCGRAVQHRKAWVVQDMLTDPLFESAREASAQTGIRAAFSVPVIDGNGRVLGSLASHYRQPYIPNAYEIERNHLFATLVAFALVKDWNQPKVAPKKMKVSA